MKMPNRVLFFLNLLPLTFFPATPLLSKEVVTLNTRPGITQSFLLLEPEGEPKGIILVFPGHKGVVEFKWRDGSYGVQVERGGFTASKNTREVYQKNGMVVALVAPPSDMKGGMGTKFRSSEKHLTDISAVIAYLNKRYQKSPYLHGHCLSSFSPASITTKLNNKGISGIILSSPRSQGRHGSVTDYTKGVINLPILLIQHANDPCKGRPYKNLGKVRKFYESSSQKVDVIIVSGGDTTQTGPGSCQNGAHSFRGLQVETASEITNWIQGKDFQTQIND